MAQTQRTVDPNGRYTWADYQTWPNRPRYELVDGDAIAMSPAPTVSHQVIVGEVFSQIKRGSDGKPCLALVAPVDVRLPRGAEADDAIDTAVLPDVLVVCDPAKIEERGVRGAPDWVVEVISRGSARHDQLVKLRVYERAGVREFWLVHPLDRVAFIYRHDGQAYGKPDVVELTGTTEVEVLPGLSIDWTPIAPWLPQLEEDGRGPA